MATAIILPGRTDVDSYFKLSRVFDAEHLNHTPLLVFSIENDTVRVSLVHNPTELLSMEDDTQVMGQWRGEWRSDFFRFSVGQYRQFVNAKDETLKAARNVVKTVGPQGGFQSLQYEYVDERGTIVHKSTGVKSEADRLEILFGQFGVPVAVEKLPSRSGKS